MEKKFLQYLLYITLIEIREVAYEERNSRIFYLTDLLHNIPGALDSEEEAKMAYSDLIDNVKSLKIENWLEHRKTEFYSRYPYYKVDDEA